MNNTTRLRPAKQDDLRVVISWIPDAAKCRQWVGPAVNFPLTPESLTQEITFSANNSYCLEKAGDPIGFGQLIHKSEQLIHAARIIIAPRVRRQGCGRSLCQSLINRAAELKYPLISLNVYKNNPTAMQLYQSLGFRKKKSKKAGLSKDICYMEKRIF